MALDAATGEKLWSVPLGSRLDTPPTVWRGLCIVGCHDGYVYAIRAKDGQFAWRAARVGPSEAPPRRVRRRRVGLAGGRERPGPQ